MQTFDFMSNSEMTTGHRQRPALRSAQWHVYTDRITCGGAARPDNVGQHRRIVFMERDRMAEGSIKRLTDKGFGFIETGTDKDMFFHMSNVEGADFDSLREGQRVSYNPGHGPKGPRAENVRPI